MDVEPMKGGGKTQKKYSDRLCKSVREYFYSFVGYWERRIKEIGDRFPGDDAESEILRTEALQRLCNENAVKAQLRGLPSLEKWAKLIGVAPSTVSHWRREYPEFDEACRDCMAIQTDILRDGGLGGLYAGRVATFLIKMNEDRAREAEQSSGGVRLEDFDVADEDEGF